MSGPRNAEDRLRRLLVMLPFLMEAGEVPLSEVARRFDMSERDVASDLELVAMCGLPPYVDEMIDVFVDEGVVVVGVPRLFTRPLRLTSPEAFSLLAAGRTAMQLPGFDGDGPLGRGLAKLATALGAAGLDSGQFDDTAGVAIDLDRPAVTDVVLDAVPDHAQLSIRHYSAARDVVSERTIVPRHVFVDTGHWYVRADDDASGERRTFRIDRIEHAERTGRTVPPVAGDDASGPVPFFADAELPRARLRVAPGAQWIVETYPVDRVEPAEPDGWVEVALPVTSDRWLARLLLRLGPNAELADPVVLRGSVADLGRRILSGYERAAGATDAV